jgi:hypothetical protein
MYRMASTTASYARLNSSEESSAPRRRLDGGVSPCSGLVAAVAKPAPAVSLSAARSWLLTARGGVRPVELPDGVPAVERGRSGRQRQDACPAVRRWSASTRRCPPIRLRRPSSGVGSPAVRCLVTWLHRPAVRPSGRPAVRPSGCLVSARPGVQPSVSGVLPSARSGQSRPASGGEVGDQVGAAGQRPPIRCPAVRCPPVQPSGVQPSGCPGSASSCVSPAVASGTT